MAVVFPQAAPEVQHGIAVPQITGMRYIPPPAPRGDFPTDIVPGQLPVGRSGRALVKPVSGAFHILNDPVGQREVSGGAGMLIQQV